MRRFISAIAFAATLVVVLGAAGCGQRFDRDAGNAPAPADLAANALEALEEEGSAHFVADLKSEAPQGVVGGGEALSLHFEGDASGHVLDTEGSVSFGFGTLSGRVLVDDHELFVQFLNQWYREPQGLADITEKAKMANDGQVWNKLATPVGVRQTFDLLFDGAVSEGPAIDGVATWRFQGQLDAEGIITLAKRFGQPVPPDEAAIIRTAAAASKFVIVVGQDDRLPRRLELSVHVKPEDLNQMQNSGYANIEGAENFTSTLVLSEFGKRVDIDLPTDFKPLDELFSQLFSGFE